MNAVPPTRSLFVTALPFEYANDAKEGRRVNDEPGGWDQIINGPERHARLRPKVGFSKFADYTRLPKVNLDKSPLTVVNLR